MILTSPIRYFLLMIAYFVLSRLYHLVYEFLQAFLSGSLAKYILHIIYCLNGTNYNKSLYNFSQECTTLPYILTIENDIISGLLIAIFSIRNMILTEAYFTYLSKIPPPKKKTQKYITSNK